VVLHIGQEHVVRGKYWTGTCSEGVNIGQEHVVRGKHWIGTCSGEG